MKSAVKLLFFFAICFVSYRWDSIIDSFGVAVPGTITEKRESVRTNNADWFRRFQITSAFQAPGFPLVRHAICDVDQQNFDGLHVGSPVTVHYLPALLGIPLLPSTHISPCPPWGIFGSNPELYRRSLYIYGSLAIIIGIVFVLRVRRAAWLLLPWSAVFVLFGLCPHTEPKPVQPQRVSAVVKGITIVKTLVESAEDDTPPITLNHPYQLVELQYTPQGRREPVTAVDAIDQNSITDLKAGQVLDIDYDAGNPRIAAIPGATRLFREQAIHQIGLTYLILVAVFLVLLLFARRSRRSPRRAAV